MASATFEAIKQELRIAQGALKTAQVEQAVLRESSEAMMDELRSAECRAKTAESKRLALSKVSRAAAASLRTAESRAAITESQKVELCEMQFRMETMEIKQDALRHELCGAHLRTQTFESEWVALQASSEKMAEQLCSALDCAKVLEVEKSVLHAETKSSAEEMYSLLFDNHSLKRKQAALQASHDDMVDKVRESQCRVAVLETHSAELQRASEKSTDQLRSTQQQIAVLEADEAILDQLCKSQCRVESLEMEEFRNSQCHLETLEAYSTELYASSENTIEELQKAQHRIGVLEFGEAAISSYTEATMEASVHGQLNSFDAYIRQKADVEQRRLLCRVESAEAERDELHAAFEAMLGQLCETFHRADAAEAELVTLRASHKERAATFMNELGDIHKDSVIAREGLLRERARLQFKCLVLRVLMWAPRWQISRPKVQAWSAF